MGKFICKVKYNNCSAFTMAKGKSVKIDGNRKQQRKKR